MRYGDIIPLSGLRHDGRRYHEFRPIKFHLGIHATADGSCEYNQGLTKILVTTEGPKEVKKPFAFFLSLLFFVTFWGNFLRRKKRV